MILSEIDFNLFKFILLNHQFYIIFVIELIILLVRKIQILIFVLIVLLLWDIIGLIQIIFLCLTINLSLI